jgi:hypothetical protein
MALSKLARTAIVEEFPGAEATLVVTQQLANLPRSLFVIQVTRIAVQPVANLLQMARYAVPAPAFAILKRSAVALQQLALLTLQLQMVSFRSKLFLLTNSIQGHRVVTPSPVRLDSVHLVIFSAKL